MLSKSDPRVLLSSSSLIFLTRYKMSEVTFLINGTVFLQGGVFILKSPVILED